MWVFCFFQSPTVITGIQENQTFVCCHSARLVLKIQVVCLLKLWISTQTTMSPVSRDQLLLSLSPTYILFRYLTFYAREDLRYKAKRSGEAKHPCFTPHLKGKASWPTFVVCSSQESDKHSSSI